MVEVGRVFFLQDQRGDRAYRRFECGSEQVAIQVQFRAPCGRADVGLQQGSQFDD